MEGVLDEEEENRTTITVPATVKIVPKYILEAFSRNCNERAGRSVATSKRLLAMLVGGMLLALRSGRPSLLLPPYISKEDICDELDGLQRRKHGLRGESV